LTATAGAGNSTALWREEFKNSLLPFLYF